MSKYTYTKIHASQVKVGDLIAYKNRGEYRYAVIKSTQRKFERPYELWGAWRDTIEEALMEYDYSLYIDNEEVYLVKKGMNLTRFLEEYS